MAAHQYGLAYVGTLARKQLSFTEGERAMCLVTQEYETSGYPPTACIAPCHNRLDTKHSARMAKARSNSGLNSGCWAIKKISKMALLFIGRIFFFLFFDWIL